MPNWDTYSAMTSPADGDTLLLHDVSEAVVGDKMKKMTWSNAKAALMATSAEINTGTETAKVINPDKFAGSNYGIRVVEIALNGSVALTTSDKAYFRIPSVCNGWNLVSVAAMCKTNTTGPTITVKNGATSMLSTNITIDNGEYDTATAATPPVIDTAHDDVATGAQIEIAVSTAGSNVTYAVVELGFQLP